MQALYSFFVYLLLVLVQTAVCFGLCVYYTAAAPQQLVSSQTIFLAFYRSSFLHSLLPMGEFFLWVRNFLLLAALGCGAAHFPFIQRKNKFPATLIGLLMFTAVFFSSRNVHIGNIPNILFTIIICCCVLAEIFYTVYQKEEPENE